MKGIIVSLKRSSSSEDGNNDHNNEGGGKRLSSPDNSQRNSMFYFPAKDQRHSLSYSHSSNKTLPLWGTVHYLFSFFAPSPGAGHGPIANSQAHGRKEKKRSNPPTHHARLLPYPPMLMPVHTHSCSLSSLVLPTGFFIGTTHGVSICFYCVTIPINSHGFTIHISSHGFTICFRDLHSFSQARVLSLLQLKWIQQDCTSCLTFHPIKLYAFNDNNPTCWWVIHHSRPRPGIGVGV